MGDLQAELSVQLSSAGESHCKAGVGETCQAVDPGVGHTICVLAY